MTVVDVDTGEVIDVRAIPLGLIDNGPAVRRELLDDAHAQALWENIDQLPNIAVRVTGDRYQLIDGRHRLAAHKFAKRDTITAEVYDVDDRQLWIMAVEANTSHGRPLDLAERKAVAAQLLKVAPDLSNRAIAKHCGLNRGTIGKMRPEADDAGVQNGHLPERRTGADGKSYPVPAKPEPVMGEATDREAVGVESEDVPSSPTFDPGEAAIGDDAEEPSLPHTSPGSTTSDDGRSPHGADLSDWAGGMGASSAVPPADPRPLLHRQVKAATVLFTAWSPEQIHALNDPELTRSFELLLPIVGDWFEEFTRTEPTGLTVIEGGRQ